MNFAIAAAVFPIIFIGELPDKTMFASLVMSTRGKPFAVWLGAAAAFTIHVVIATTIGVALFHVVPHRALEGIVAGLFLAGAGLALREGLRERQHEEREEKLVETEVGAHGRRTLTTSFIVIFIAEWGDLTQILTANLAARYHSPVSVGVGAVVALWTVAAIAVVGGQTLLRIVNVTTVRFVTAVVLTGLAGYTAWLAVR
jgi:putative Ca2+/H+ antiporter (TMEM165/GDT1 family)